MFNRHPDGFTLLRADASTYNRIRGDLIPKGTRVITHGALIFVDTDERDVDGFAVFVEDHDTFEYVSHGD